MSGPGAALRLHEFRERLNSEESDQLARKTVRQGRDVRGLYPGELGRVHIIHSPSHRVRFGSLEHPTETRSRLDQDQYHRSFDLLAYQALAGTRHNDLPLATTPTSYQRHFGTWASLYVPAETKYTLCSHPEPLQGAEQRVATSPPQM